MSVLRSWLLRACVACLCACGTAQQTPVQTPTTSPETPSQISSSRFLVIEAEDLGMAHSIDKASFAAFENGWVTSAGVLAPAPWFPEVVRWARNHPNADLGLQIDLNAEWVSYRWRASSSQAAGSGLRDPAGYLPNSAQYIARHAKPEEVAAEIHAQMEDAQQAGVPLTHLDAHGGIVLFTPWLFREYWKAATEFQLPAVLSKEYVLQRGKPTAKENIYDVGGVEVDISTLPIDRVSEAFQSSLITLGSLTE